MSQFRTRMRHASLLLAPLAIGVLTACGGADQRLDEQLKADLAAAAQAPGNRGQFASPAELGYPQGYARGSVELRSGRKPGGDSASVVFVNQGRVAPDQLCQRLGLQLGEQVGAVGLDRTR